MPTHQVLVEMLHGEVAIQLAIKLLHSLELAPRRSPRRNLADPPVTQALDPGLLVAHTQPPKMPARHPEQLSGLLTAQPMATILLERLLKAPHENLP